MYLGNQNEGQNQSLILLLWHNIMNKAAERRKGFLGIAFPEGWNVMGKGSRERTLETVHSFWNFEVHPQ